MSKIALGSLIKGLIVLSILSVTTFIYLDAKSGVKVSNSSKISADSYVVGADYSGLITKQFVKKGDFIEKGQELVYIKSGAVLEDLNAGRVSEKDLLYPLAEDKQIIIKATQDGRVSEVNYTEGSYVPANNTIIMITASKNPFVITEYQLSKKDFTLLNKQTKMRVKLPNGTNVISPIEDITINSSPTDISSKFRIIIKSDIEPDSNILIGSPVTTHLYLNQQTALQKIVDLFK